MNIPTPKKGVLSGILTIVLTIGAYLLAWKVGVSVREKEWFLAADFLVLTIAAVWLWFWIRRWPS